MFGYLQRIGRALMLPIAVLPAAALLLRLGQEDLLNIPVMAQAGDALFANLALLFAIGIAIGLSKDGSGAAALSGAVGYLVLANVTRPLMKILIWAYWRDLSRVLSLGHFTIVFIISSCQIGLHSLAGGDLFRLLRPLSCSY